MRQSVVLPTPLPPTIATFSPLVISVLKLEQIDTPGQLLVNPSIVRVCFPDGFLTGIWMNGRSMLDRLSCVTCSFSICFLRL